MKDTCFLITAYDQLREVRFTIDMLRNKWESTRESPVVLVISGDKNRTIIYEDDPFTRVIHLDDMVKEKAKVLVSTSIMKQIEHGMIEVKDLEREHGPINSILHIHGDILLLGEKGFLHTFHRWRASKLPIAADNVSANGPHLLDLWGKKYRLSFHGEELMPQLFAVDHNFCKATSFMYSMPIVGDLEEKATEWALIGNLHRASCGDKYLFAGLNEWHHATGPYKKTFDELVYVVKKGRSQWALHDHWGGFCHFGSIHCSREETLKKDRIVLERYGLDLSEW